MAPDAEALALNWRGAVLLIFRKDNPGGRPLRRSAVFLYTLPGGGFSWVEPHAWDPEGASSPARHDRPRAKLSWLSPGNPNVGLLYEDDEVGESGMVYEWRPDDYPAVPELEAFYAQAERDGLDLKAERERVRPALSGGLPV